MRAIKPTSCLAIMAAVSILHACAQQPVFADDIQKVRGYWLTEDSALIIEITDCGPDAPVLCGFIRALPGVKTDAELAQYASELCGLPLLSNLTYDEAKQRWGAGDIFDPETEQMYDVFIRYKADHLKVRAYAGSEWIGETLKWTPTQFSNEGCPTGAENQ